MIERIITVTTTGKIHNYPNNKQLKFKKFIVNNPINIYNSSEELLKKVESDKLTKAFELRIKNMMYRTAISYWKDFEYIVLDLFNKVDNISTEEGNKLQSIKQIRKEMIIGLS